MTSTVNTHRIASHRRASLGRSRASSRAVVARARMVRCCPARDGAYAHIDASTREDVDAGCDDASRKGDDAGPPRAHASDDDDDDERSTTTEAREDAEGDGGDVIVAIDDDGDGGGADGRGGGRRSAWDRAGAPSTTASEDARSERSATHSTFGRHRRERKVSRAVERALGGAGAYDEDDDEEYAPTAAAKRAVDEEAGFGFVSKSDIARRDAERAAKAKAKAEAERAAAARKAAKELAKRKAVGLSDDDETMSLLSADIDELNGNQRRRSRKKGGKKMSVLAYTVIVSCAVVAACVGIVIYVPAPTTSSAVVSNSVATATDAGSVLTSSSSSSSSTVRKEKKKEMDITKDLEKKLTSKSRSKTASTSAKDDDDEKDDKDDDDKSSTKSKKTSKSSTKDVEEDEYDEEPANEDEEDGKNHKSGAVEAKLGRFAWLDDDEVADKGADDAKEAPIRATRECAPIHVETRHGMYRQFNQECLASDDGVLQKPAGCLRGSADGCQSCYISNSPAASQLTSYSWCSQHVCETYGVVGCETDPSKRRPSSTLGVDEKPATKSKKSSASIAAAAAARGDGEACLPNLEDAKRGIFQYSAHHCRTMGHAHVDYSGCVSIGKSSCRMCVTKSTLQGTVFSLCPKSVCENHDLLYSQCADDDGVE